MIDVTQAAPAAASPPSSEAVLEHVASTYAIGTPTGCRLLQAASNNTYLLTGRGFCYVVRVYGENRRTASEVAFEMELVVHLAQKGVPVTVPVPDRDGRWIQELSVPQGRLPLVVFTYAEGERQGWDEKLSYSIGGLAAAIHAASDDFSSRHFRLCADLEHKWLEQPLARLEPQLVHRPQERDYLQAVGLRLRDQVREAISAGLDWGPCHGDFWPANVHLAGDGSLTVIDFEQCGYGWRAWDLVWMHHHPGPRGDRFLQGYTERRPLGAADLAALPLFKVLLRLWSLGKQAQRAARKGIPMDEDTLHQAVTCFRAWESEPTRR